MTIYNRNAIRAVLGVTLSACLIVVPAAWAAPTDTMNGDRVDPHTVKQWRDQDDRLSRGCSSGLVGNGGGTTGTGGSDSDGDGVGDRCDFFPEDPTRSGPFRIGTLSSLDNMWQTVLMPGRYVNPVLIVGPPSNNDSEPGVVQLDRITEISFDVRFKEWSYLDGFHDAESVPYILAEAGRYAMADGSTWEFGTFDIRHTRLFPTATFSEPFLGAPALFLTAQSSNGRDPFTARARKVGTDGFRVTLWEEEALNDGHQLETLGFVAIHSPQRSGLISIDGGNVPYLLQTPALDERTTPVMSWNLVLQEEQSLDGEMRHRDEIVAVMNLGGHVFGQDVSAMGRDTVTLRRRDPVAEAPMEWGTVDNVNEQWLHVPLAKVYSNPVVVVKVASSRDMDPGMLRVRGVSGTSFEMHFEEWSYQDALHAGERVFYMVAEAGQHDLAGLTVEAGTLATAGTLDAGDWHTVELSAPFLGAPGVFASVQSAVNNVPSITRVELRSSTSFRLAMQEEEGSLVDARSAETLGWIAIDMGRVVAENGRSIDVRAHRVDSSFRTVHFVPIQRGRFRTVVADVATVKESDPVSLRHAYLGRNRIQVMLQEEQSLDAEMSHVREEVCFFIAE